MNTKSYQKKYFHSQRGREALHPSITNFNLVRAGGSPSDVSELRNEINSSVSIIDPPSFENNSDSLDLQNAELFFFHLNNSDKSPRGPGSTNVRPAINHRDRLLVNEQLDRGVETSRKDQPEGLPNIGNTCFLNSILQFLYGATEAKNFLIQKYKLFTRRNKTEKFKSSVYLVGKLFWLMDERRNDQKINVLRVLMHSLETLNAQYVKWSQEDAITTLNSLIEDIGQDFQLFKSFFVVQSLAKCKCNCDRIISRQLFISSSTESCAICSADISKSYLETPEYLIVANDNEIKYKITFSNIRYQFVSGVIYFGTGSFGHYISLRVSDNMIYEFNDSTVTNKYNHLENIAKKIESANAQISKCGRLRLSMYQRRRDDEIPQTKEEQFFSFTEQAPSLQPISELLSIEVNDTERQEIEAEITELQQRIEGDQSEAQQLRRDKTELFEGQMQKSRKPIVSKLSDHVRSKKTVSIYELFLLIGRVRASVRVQRQPRPLMLRILSALELTPKVLKQFVSRGLLSSLKVMFSKFIREKEVRNQIELLQKFFHFKTSWLPYQKPAEVKFRRTDIL